MFLMYGRICKIFLPPLRVASQVPLYGHTHAKIILKKKNDFLFSFGALRNNRHNPCVLRTSIIYTFLLHNATHVIISTDNQI